MPEVALESASAFGWIIERAMRHTSPETKCIHQLSMVAQVREAMEKSNQRCMTGTSRFTDAFYRTLK
jgi:hypothetical protein